MVQIASMAYTATITSDQVDQQLQEGKIERYSRWLLTDTNLGDVCRICITGDTDKRLGTARSGESGGSGTEQESFSPLVIGLL